MCVYSGKIYRKMFVRAFQRFSSDVKSGQITLYVGKAFVVVDVCCTTFYIPNWDLSRLSVSFSFFSFCHDVGTPFSLFIYVI